MGWASGSGPSQEGSSEAPVVLINAEAWSRALRLGWALGPTDSKVSWTAGPSPALPAQGHLQTQGWHHPEGLQSSPLL